MATPPTQMTFRGITSSGDWTWGNGVQNYLVGEQAIETNIQTALQILLGECFWNTTFGVDWITLLSSAGAAQTAANIILQTRTIIVQAFGVTSVNSVIPFFNSLTRNFRLTYNISTIYAVNVLGQLVNPLS